MLVWMLLFVIILFNLIRTAYNIAVFPKSTRFWSVVANMLFGIILEIVDYLRLIREYHQK